jgi:hypothetical protein
MNEYLRLLFSDMDICCVILQVFGDVFKVYSEKVLRETVGVDQARSKKKSLPLDEYSFHELKMFKEFIDSIVKAMRTSKFNIDEIKDYMKNFKAYGLKNVSGEENQESAFDFEFFLVKRSHWSLNQKRK